MGWLNEIFPDNEQWQKFSNGVVSITEKLKDSIEIGEFKVYIENILCDLSAEYSFGYRSFPSN